MAGLLVESCFPKGKVRLLDEFFFFVEGYFEELVTALDYDGTILFLNNHFSVVVPGEFPHEFEMRRLCFVELHANIKEDNAETDD